jgi:hypothetical protein
LTSNITDPGLNQAIQARLSGGSVTFGDAINLIHTHGGLSHKIAASENNLYIVWSDIISTSNEILFITSTDKGDTFGDAINLSNNAGFSEAPAIAVSM